MKNKDNLGDFLQKKLNQFGDEPQAWECPSTAVREKTLANIHANIQGRSKKKKYLLLALLFLIGFALLFCGGQYIYNLHQDLNSYKEHIKLKETTLGFYNNNIQKTLADRNTTENKNNLKTEQNSNINERGNNKTKTTINPINSDFEAERQQYKDELSEQNRRIQFLENKLAIASKNQPEQVQDYIEKNEQQAVEITQLKNNITTLKNQTEQAQDYTKINQAQAREIAQLKDYITELEGQIERLEAGQNADQEEFSNLSVIKPKQLEVVDSTNLNTKFVANTSAKRNKNYRKHFRLAVYGQTGRIGMPTLDFSTPTSSMTTVPYDPVVDSLPFSTNTQQINNHGFGLEFEYVFHKNFAIHTGATMNLARNKDYRNVVFDYPKYQEELASFDSSLYSNSVQMNHYTPQEQISYSLDFYVPSIYEIQNGEGLSLKYYETKEITTFQLPIGLTYTFGKDKLKGLIKAGVQWNYRQTKTRLNDLQVLARYGNFLSIARMNNEVYTRNNQSYFSIYGNIGVTYALHPLWDLQTSLFYQHNFKNKQQIAIPSSRSYNLGIQLGISRKF